CTAAALPNTLDAVSVRGTFGTAVPLLVSTVPATMPRPRYVTTMLSVCPLVESAIAEDTPRLPSVSVATIAYVPSVTSGNSHAPLTSVNVVPREVLGSLVAKRSTRAPAPAGVFPSGRWTMPSITPAAANTTLTCADPFGTFNVPAAYPISWLAG